MPTKKSTVEATLKDVEDKWEASFISHDPSVAQAYLGDDYRGKAFKRNFRWTDAWVDRNGKWQCVASQSLLLSK